MEAEPTFLATVLEVIDYVQKIEHWRPKKIALGAQKQKTVPSPREINS